MSKETFVQASKVVVKPSKFKNWHSLCTINNGHFQIHFNIWPNIVQLGRTNLLLTIFKNITIFNIFSNLVANFKVILSCGTVLLS